MFAPPQGGHGDRQSTCRNATERRRHHESEAHHNEGLAGVGERAAAEAVETG